MRTTERYIADADPQTILEPTTGGRYLCSDPISTYYIFSTYDSISAWYNIDDTKAAGYIMRDMILDKVALKQGKTRCGRGLITDQKAHVVTDVNLKADIE